MLVTKMKKECQSELVKDLVIMFRQAQHDILTNNWLYDITSPKKGNKN